jgi:DNA-binding FrmR family transcriptional regulator
MFDLAAAYQFVGSPRICRFGGPRERTTQSDQAAHLVGYDLGELAGIETAQATADEAQSASAVALEQLIDTRQHVALEVGTQTEVAALLPAMRLVAMRMEEAPERAGAVVLRLQHKDRMPIAARDDGGEPRPRMARARRIRGQVEALERALDGEIGCAEVFRLIASIRGAANGLMSEVPEDYIRLHVAAPALDTSKRKDGAEELIDVMRSYLK